jgi:hypothetical protein
MNKFFIAVGQIAVGIVAGNVLDKVVNQGVAKPVKKLIVNAKAKKGA